MNNMRKLRENVQKRFATALSTVSVSSSDNHNQNGLTPEDDPEILPESTVNFAISSYKVQQTRTLPLTNPQRSKEVLESIESIYYSDDSNFSPGIYELEKLRNDDIDVNALADNRNKLKDQLSVVSKKISDMILENHPSYAAELQKVTELQCQLNDVCRTCREARSGLLESQHFLSSVGIRILANHRKIQFMRSLLQRLEQIKMLQETDFRLRELLEEGNYSDAIQLCLECHRAAETFSQFTCIGELSLKLADTLVDIERQLDRAVASMALQFDPLRYRSLSNAYHHLEKFPELTKSLVRHTLSAIQSSTISLVDSAGGGGDADVLVSYSVDAYRFVCQRIPPDKLLSCLTEIGTAVWRITANYHAVIQYHLEEADALLASASEERSASVHLEQQMPIVWREVLSLLTTLLSAVDMHGFKFDHFLQVVRFTNRVSELGRCHWRQGDAESSELRRLIGGHSSAYFRQHHAARLEELHMFLESEGWAHCPLPHSFTVRQLPEFSFLATFQLPSVTTTTATCATNDKEEETDSVSYELIRPERQNPFAAEAIVGVIKKGDSTSLESDSEESDDLKQDYIEEESPTILETTELTLKPNAKMSPVTCNTALNLLRLFGRYINMGAMLEPIAYDSVVYTVQLFDYFFYSVVRLFSGDFSADSSLEPYSVKLFNTLQRIDGTLIAAKSGVNPGSSIRVPASGLSPAVNLNQPERLFGLAERVVAVESLVFVSRQLIELQPVLESFVPPDKKAFLQQFFAQTVSAAVDDARNAVYGAVASRALNCRLLKQRVVATNWDISELRSQHSPYVDALVQEFDAIQRVFTEVRRLTPVSKEAHDCLWTMAIRCVNRVLVEGYASCGGLPSMSRCTNEGRMLMQLDYQQLVVKLEALCGVRPLPDKDHVENYIKAYYLPESAVEKWILEHQEYTNRQLASVLRVATHISKKSRQRLLAMLEDGVSATN